MSKISEEFEEARKSVEKEIGLEIPDNIFEWVLDYTRRKFNIMRTRGDFPDRYMIILFENELRDYFMRFAINLASVTAQEEREAGAI